MQLEGKTVHLVPVAINYDRLFEIRNIATENVSGDPGTLKMTDVHRMISDQSTQTLGKVYMTFGQEVDLAKYLQEQKLAPLTAGTTEQAVCSLTSDLVLQHTYASPVTLNSIVAAILLQCSSSVLKLNDLFRASRRIYAYLVEREGVKLVMREPPSLLLVQNTVLKLGFSLSQIKDKANRKPAFLVSLDAKSD